MPSRSITKANSLSSRSVGISNFAVGAYGSGSGGIACLEFTVPLSRSDTASDVDLDFCERRVFGLRSLVGEPIFPNSKDFVVARCNSEACTRFVQAHGALACLERALQIVDALELSSLIGARIQHAMDALESELRRLEGVADEGE